MTLVAGIDSSTQSCKVSVRHLETGEQVREGKAAHPAGTILNPEAWWEALLVAVQRAGGLEDVAAISVSGQQHTPIFLAEDGTAACDSPLWNDTGSHQHMVDLNRELGRDEWIRRTGMPITLSDTVVKLRWLRDTDPAAAERTAAVAIVHDWLTWRLRGFGPDRPDLTELTTDRSEASGTAYWSGETNEYCMDLFTHAFGKSARLPRILGPLDRAGVTGAGVSGVAQGIPVGVGSGDNAAAALALDLQRGDAVLSLGTSGVIYTPSAHPIHDFEGYVCNYADATGAYIPIVATLNAARNFESAAELLACSHGEFSALALEAAPAAGGLTLLPFFEGERTPDLPHARGSLHGMTLDNFTRPNIARACIEGTLMSQVGMLDALEARGLHVRRLMLIGGAAQSPAVREVLRQLVELPLIVPDHDEYVTKGSAMQAAAALTGAFPLWPAAHTELPQLPLETQIAQQYRDAMRAMGYRGSPSARGDVDLEGHAARV